MLELSWIGRRVSVRRVVAHTSAGRAQYGDVVGDLLALDASGAVIDTRHGPVEVDLASVTIAKTAPPSTADELGLERVAALGWRAAETQPLGGWLLRASGGFTGRGNSVLPLRQPGMALDEALAQARQWYATRELPARLQVPVEARRLLDAGLGERGWWPSTDVHVMAAHLSVLRAPSATTRVGLDDAPDDAWYRRYRDGDGATGAARALLTRHDELCFASVRDGGRAVAIGRGVVDEGWLGISAVEVEPERRREGLGTAIMDALRTWGAGRGASRAYLQVSVDNPAVAMYERLGYWVHHDYRYRTAPE